MDYKVWETNGGMTITEIDFIGALHAYEFDDIFAGVRWFLPPDVEDCNNCRNDLNNGKLPAGIIAIMRCKKEYEDQFDDPDNLKVLETKIL